MLMEPAFRRKISQNCATMNARKSSKMYAQITTLLSHARIVAGICFYLPHVLWIERKIRVQISMKVYLSLHELMSLIFGRQWKIIPVLQLTR